MWITANLLLHQTDAITHNFYLYNPLGSDKFYFLPWDYDGGLQPESLLTNSLDNEELAKRLFFGYARGINSQFVSNYYRLPGIHGKILAAADEIHSNYLTGSNIDERAQRYTALIAPYVTRPPDLDFTSFNPDIAGNFASYVAGIHDQMRTDFAVPMPPGFNDPEIEDGVIRLSWKLAYDVTRSSELSYDLDIATTVSFDAGSIVYSATAIADNEDLVEHAIDTAQLPGGTLYARLVARGDINPQRYWQIADDVVRQDGKTWFGVIEFDVP